MADRFWVGGTNTWTQTGASGRWALTSGGANTASAPTSTDRAIFDANSGSGVVTTSGVVVVASILCTGFVGTITGSSSLTINGNVTLAAGMTWSHTALTLGVGAGDITTVGKTLGNVTINATATTKRFVDNFTSSANLTITAGTADFGTFDPDVALGVTVSVANGATLTMGDGDWSVGNSGTSGTVTFSFGAIINPGAQPIIINGTSQKQITIAGQTVNDITVTAAAEVILASATVGTVGTIGDLDIGPATSLYLVFDNIVALGTLTAPNVTLCGTYTASPGGGVFESPSELRLASGTHTFSDCLIFDLTFAGGATWEADDSYDGGGVVGLTFNPIPAYEAFGCIA